MKITDITTEDMRAWIAEFDEDNFARRAQEDNDLTDKMKTVEDFAVFSIFPLSPLALISVGVRLGLWLAAHTPAVETTEVAA